MCLSLEAGHFGSSLPTDDPVIIKSEHLDHRIVSHEDQHGQGGLGVGSLGGKDVVDLLSGETECGSRCGSQGGFWSGDAGEVGDEQLVVGGGAGETRSQVEHKPVASLEVGHVGDGRCCCKGEEQTEGEHGGEHEG